MTALKKEDKMIFDYEINGMKYELVRNDGDCFDYDVVKEKATDYFDEYDYI